jgi:hypothetical protein
MDFNVAPASRRLFGRHPAADRLGVLCVLGG